MSSELCEREGFLNLTQELFFCNTGLPVALEITHFIVGLWGVLCLIFFILSLLLPFCIQYNWVPLIGMVPRVQKKATTTEKEEGENDGDESETASVAMQWPRLIQTQRSPYKKVSRQERFP